MANEIIIKCITCDACEHYDKLSSTKRFLAYKSFCHKMNKLIDGHDMSDNSNHMLPIPDNCPLLNNR